MLDYKVRTELAQLRCSVVLLCRMTIYTVNKMITFCCPGTKWTNGEEGLMQAAQW